MSAAARLTSFSPNATLLHHLRSFFKTHAESEDVLDFQRKEFIEHGDRVFVLGDYAARSKSTGRTWQTSYVHDTTMHDGKVQRVELYFNTAAAAEAYTELQKSTTA